MLVYHFLDEIYGLLNLKNRRLKISLFDSVNDPFELLCHGLGDKNLRRQIGKLKKSAAASSGMICFSKTMSSPVQWAHYANRHKGLCLGFDVPVQFLTPVRYVSERVNFHLNYPLSEVEIDARIEEFLVTKYDHWSYEEEVRLFGGLGIPDQDSGLYFKSFGSDVKLVEVYVGSASSITKAELADALGELVSNVKCFKVRPAFNSFNMVRDLSEDWNI